MSDNNNEREGSKKSEHNFQATGTSIGLCLGVAFGLIFDNLAVGMGIGLCLGLAIGTYMDKGKKDKSSAENSDKKD